MTLTITSVLNWLGRYIPGGISSIYQSAYEIIGAGWCSFLQFVMVGINLK